MKLKKPVIVVLVFVAVILSAILIIWMLIGPAGNKAMLKDIAYKANIQSPDWYTVYIQEDGVYEPYLAIEGNYHGSVLLLRKYLTDEKVPYNSSMFVHKGLLGYYPISEVDEHLNTVQLSKFSPAMQEMILDTPVTVANQETVYHSGPVDDMAETEEIERKIFLLSATEMGIRGLTSTVEGQPLKYCTNRANKIQTNENGSADAYWLRSTYHWGDQAWVIWADGKTGGGGVSQTLPIQPVFCLSGDTLLHKEEVNGKKVYVVSQ